MTLISALKKRGKLLDVGCGTGYFLKYLKENYPTWKIFGIEPSDLLRKVASDNIGINIKIGTLDRIPFPDEYFDVVTCNDVLEHSAKLRENILELKRVLKPNGILFVQAPNYSSVMAYITGKKWDWWCVPDHLLHFSYSFLISYLKKNGLTIINSYTYEDQIDYLSNIKGVFSKNYFTKAVFILLIPLLLLIERLGWFANYGGLTVVIAKK